MDESNQVEPFAGIPPTQQGMLEMEPSESKWPLVIGVISMIYAIIGLSCQLFAGAWFSLNSTLPEMWRGGITMPPVIRLTAMAQILLTMALGIFMLNGAIALIRRRRFAVGRLKLWAVLRVAMILLQVVVGVLTGPAQIEMGHQQTEYLRRLYAEKNIKTPVPEPTDQQIWQRAMIGVAVSVGITSVYPLFLGIYLTRKRIIADADKWR